MKIKWLLLIVVFSGLAFLRCSDKKATETREMVNKPFPISIIRLEPRLFNEYIQVTGTVEPKNHVNILAEEGGLLTMLLRDKGMYVRKGDTLAVLENVILAASYKEAAAALKQAELDKSSKAVLYEQKAISENEYLTSEYGFERSKALYELAAARFSKLAITAPLSGVVNDRYYDQGAYILPMTPVFDLIDNSRIKITAGIAERFLPDIRKGTPADITFDTLPEFRLASQVSYVNNSIDTASRTFQIEIEMANPGNRLAPQMQANIRLIRRTFADQIIIPIDALMESEKGSYVFIEKDQVAKLVPVQIIATYEEQIAVRGLEKDQHLIVVGQQDLTEGDFLLIVNNNLGNNGKGVQ